MTINTGFYSIPMHLNHGPRLVGLPRDEVAPALLWFGVCFAAHHHLLGGALGLLWFLGLRYLKVQYGQTVLVRWGYWWSIAPLSRLFFTLTPPAEYRYWLS
ncbi:type IV conjugative transfer system protein TraL [Vibrio coralliilyticus]|uniref:type IV conjugative transfer system protein TraL n=1 Tax=Vibrio coralliilyticus TaxID=190893 RepID=UPI001560EC7A|nr:type IV conjugative transfer system protein TraL [Vibrio coralliilyticus]